MAQMARPLSPPATRPNTPQVSAAVNVPCTSLRGSRTDALCFALTWRTTMSSRAAPPDRSFSSRGWRALAAALSLSKHTSSTPSCPGPLPLAPVSAPASPGPCATSLIGSPASLHRPWRTFTVVPWWCCSSTRVVGQPVVWLVLLHVGGWPAVGMVERGDVLGDGAELQVLLRDQLAGLGRGVRVGSPRLDRRLDRQRLQERTGRGGHRVRHPEVREIELMLLTRVPFQVVNMRDAVGHPGGIEVVLLEQVPLPLPPFDRLQPVAVEAQDDLAAGLLGVTEQEAAHVHPVDHPVRGDGAAAGEHQGGEQVDLVHHLVADLARGHLARPADDARGPVRALQRGEQRAAPRAGEPVPQPAEWVRVTSGLPVG